MKSLRPILGDCWVVSVMPRYISCPAKLVCLVSESSFPVLFCRDVSCRCRAPVICPPLPLSQLFVAGALLTLHWAAGRGAGGKRVGNSQCSKSRCRPWLNTRAGSAARAGTPANYLDTELSLVDPPCVTAPVCHRLALPSFMLAACVKPLSYGKARAKSCPGDLKQSRWGNRSEYEMSFLLFIINVHCSQDEMFVYLFEDALKDVVGGHIIWLVVFDQNI